VTELESADSRPQADGMLIEALVRRFLRRQASTALI
jgi:hypothetical protein